MRTGIIQSTLCRAYRFFRHHGGYGVHSPYAYHLITQVIGERRGYYAYDDIELVRKQLAQQGEWHRDLTAKEGKLLFRLANFIGARQIVQLGATDGLAALYLTYHSREAQCVVVEPEPERARNASKVYERWGRGAIELREGDYIKQMALLKIDKIDLFVVDPANSTSDVMVATEIALSRFHDQTLLVVEHLRDNMRSMTYWEWLIKRSEPTVTIDLCTIGIVVFNRKLHKRNYKIYF